MGKEAAADGVRFLGCFIFGARGKKGISLGGNGIVNKKGLSPGSSFQAGKGPGGAAVKNCDMDIGFYAINLIPKAAVGEFFCAQQEPRIITVTGIIKYKFG